MLKIGLVGCGTISSIHIDAIIKSDSSYLSCVCDIKKDVVDRVSEKYGCNSYTSYVEMLETEDIDVVHICTPHFLHKEMIAKALSLNINVFCEKPVIMSMDEYSQVQSALNKSRATLGISFQNRYNPTSKLIRKFIDEGELGKLKGLKGFVTWNRPSEYYQSSDWRGRYETEGGGFLINQAIHTIDLIQWFGGEIDTVEGSFSTKGLKEVIEVEDTAEIYFKFKSGAIGLFYGTNSYAGNSSVDMELLFENGCLRLLNEKLYFESPDKELTLLEEDFKSSVPGKSYWGASHERAIESFYQSVLGNDNYIALDEAVKAISVLDTVRALQLNS